MLHMFLEYKSGVMIIRLDGYINRETSYKINNYLIPVIMKQKIKNIVIDFDKVEEIDETGKEALLNLKESIIINKGSLNIINVNYKLDKIIKKLAININNKQVVNIEMVEA